MGAGVGNEITCAGTLVYRQGHPSSVVIGQPTIFWDEWFRIGHDMGMSGRCGNDGSGVCLGDDQTEAYLKDTGMTGLASAWAMARRRPI